jgi:hypothetical protein
MPMQVVIEQSSRPVPRVLIWELPMQCNGQPTENENLNRHVNTLTLQTVPWRLEGRLPFFSINHLQPSLRRHTWFWCSVFLQQCHHLGPQSRPAQLLVISGGL